LSSADAQDIKLIHTRPKIFPNHLFKSETLNQHIMKNSTPNPKEVASHKAAQLVKDNMVFGLGKGSTTAYAIKELGRRVAGGLKLLGVPTSYQSAFLATDNGIPLTNLYEHPVLDIDGADQVANIVAIKGGGFPLK
jgi:ribose 5-phosphate isomerase A